MISTHHGTQISARVKMAWTDSGLKLQKPPGRDQDPNQFMRKIGWSDCGRKVEQAPGRLQDISQFMGMDVKQFVNKIRWDLCEFTANIDGFPGLDVTYSCKHRGGLRGSSWGACKQFLPNRAWASRWLACFDGRILKMVWGIWKCTWNARKHQRTYNQLQKVTRSYDLTHL